MIHCFQQGIKSILWLALLMIVMAGTASGASISLNVGTLSYSVTQQGPIHCNPRTFLPEYSIWTFNQFVFTDLSGSSYSLPGTASLLQSGGSPCPPTSASPAVLNGPNFIISVQPSPGTLTATFQINVLTYHYDNLRTGQNIHEATLTPSNVNATQFGKLFSQSLEGLAFAQPLYVPKLNIAGGTHNVVFVVTEADWVYAFDADSNTGANSNPLWTVSLLGSGETPVPAPPGTCNHAGESGNAGQMGITSTPVIDLATNTMYVEAKSQGGANYFHRLHALDIATGQERTPPSLIAPPSGSAFGALFHQNRPGLLLVNGAVYVAFASNGCDGPNYSGWLFAYDAATLKQLGVFQTTPNGSQGGIWMSGAAPAADAAGNIYLATGNGSNLNSDYGDSILKLVLSNGSLALVDYFTPWNYSTLSANDTDLGSGGVLLLPDQSSSPQHLLVQAGKDGIIHLLDRDQLTINNQHICSVCNASTGNTNIHQEIQEGNTDIGGMWATPTYWNGKVYFGGMGESLKVLTLSNSLLSTPPGFASPDIYPWPANTSISANGANNGILWAAKADSNPPMILNAYNATTGQQLYSSATNQSRDNAGGSVHSLVPVVANGKVYLGGSQLSVYGLNPP